MHTHVYKRARRIHTNVSPFLSSCFLSSSTCSPSLSIVSIYRDNVSRGWLACTFYQNRGSCVDEKRQGFPNSNLGVGRVGKWAQCGVTLRAFALSLSIPPSISPSYPPAFALLHLPPFTSSLPPCLPNHRVKSHQHLQPSISTSSKPDRPTLIDLLILGDCDLF